MAWELNADRRQILAGFAAVMVTPSVAFAKSQGQSYEAVRATVDRYFGEKMVPHMVVAIGGREGPPEYITAGRQQMGAGPPVGPDSLYYLASMTKPIVAFAIMALIEDGKLSLDTPLSELYPAYANQQVLIDPENSLETRPAKKPMTIRHLVTHSSGLGANFNITGPLKQAYAADELAIWERYAAGTEPNKTSTLDDFAEAAASIPLLFEPGSSWKYSMGLDIAVAVVQKVSGIPFRQFLTERLLAPLGMQDTFYTVPADKFGRMTTTYNHTDDGLELPPQGFQDFYALEINHPTGSGGLISSTRDYSRFMAMLLHEGELDGVRVMKVETARLMMSDLMEPGVLATTSFGDMGNGAGGRSAIAVTRVGEAIGTYGWAGASNTMTWVDRANGVYIVIMTQVRQWYPNPIYDDFGKALYADLATD